MAFLDLILNQRWVLAEPVLGRLVDVAKRKLDGELLGADAVARITDARDEAAWKRMDAYAGLAAELGSPIPHPPSPLNTIIDGPQGVTVNKDQKAPPYFLVGDVAVVPIYGVLANHSSMVNNVSQPTGMAYATIAKNVALAVADVNARAVLLDIHSPGGTVAGGQDAYSEIQRLAATGGKPIVAYAHDQAASGGYWLASSAPHVLVSPQGEVGSIGVYMVLQDTSRSSANSGVITHVIRAGRYKGAGVEGAAVDAEQISKFQSEVDTLAGHFIAAVAQARKLSVEAAAALATGEVWIGQDAVKVGLADGVATAREAVAFASRLAAGPSKSSNSNPRILMSTKQTTPVQTAAALIANAGQAPGAASANTGQNTAKTEVDNGSPVAGGAGGGVAVGGGDARGAAIVAQLESEFGDPAFVLECVKNNSSLIEARGAYAGVVVKKLEAANATISNQTNQINTLQTQVQQLTAENNALKSRSTAHGGAPLSLGGVAPVGANAGGAASGEGAGNGAGTIVEKMQARVKAIREEKKCDHITAMGAITMSKKTEDRQLHAAWRAAGFPNVPE